MPSAQRFDILLALALLGIAASSSAIPVMPPGPVVLPDGLPPPPPGAGARDCGSGIIDTLAGGAVGDGGPAADATLHLPVGIAVGPDGSLYVADASGYRIRKIDARGKITTAAGTGHAGDVGDGALPTETGLNWPTSVAFGPDGSLYIADRYHHRVCKVDPAGTMTTVAGIGEEGSGGDGGPATQARLNSPYRVAVAADGTVYISDAHNQRIRKVDGTGVITTIAGGAASTRRGSALRVAPPANAGDGGPATAATLWNPLGLALGPDGSIFVADTYNHRVRKVDRAGIITTIAGTGEEGYSGDGGPANEAKLDHPRGVSVGPDGCLYIADTDNNRIRKVSPDGVITTVAGNGQPGYSGDRGPATQAGLQSPELAVATADGSLYIADTYNHRVRKVNAAGIITTVAGGRLGDGGPAERASLYEPRGIAIGPDGSFYIAEYMGHRVRKIGPDGTITTVAGNAQRGHSGDGGPATQASLSFPRSVALGPQGELYIAEVRNHRIRKVGAAGIITTVAGTGEEGYSGDGGPATQAKLHGPWGVAVGPGGSLYIADRENHRVRRVDAAGVITTVAGNGRAGFAGIGGLVISDSVFVSTDGATRSARSPSADGGPATWASLNYPIAVTVADDGTLYIADYFNHRVRKVDAAGIITTVAGNGRQGFGGDGGPATEASMNRPCGLAIGGDGSLYIATVHAHRVRRVDPGGIVSTVAGDGEIAYRGDGWPAAEASLSQPSDVAVGADGSLYIADATNHRIRKAWLRPCDPEAARQRADALRAGAGVSFRGWLEVAELYLIAGDWDAALAAAQKLVAGISEADEHARLRVDVLLGRIYAAKRDDHEARRCWMRVLARARDPVLLRQAAEPLVSLYLRREERHQAIATLDDLRLRTQDRDLLGWIDQRLKEIAGD